MSREASPPRDDPEASGSSPPPKAGDETAARFGADRILATLYPLFVAALVLLVARVFYGAMLAETHGRWSAPLDDVFIHFDYARSTARGYPLAWSEGNGYSSGETSVPYALVLAFGYWAFARGFQILLWAATVACVSTLAFLWASGALFSPIGRGAKFLAPLAVLSLGALDWTLFSGMETAFHLAIWGACLLAAMAAREAGDARRFARWAAVVGILGALLCLTRPESVACVAAFAAFIATSERASRRGRFDAAILASLPALIALAAQAALNRATTGEWRPNGAIVKLVTSSPYTPFADVAREYGSLLGYVVVRNTQHHFSDAIPWGWLVPLVGLVPLAAKRTRATAALLWATALLWLAVVALNGQARWQNERYAMPAVAWLMLLAAMGVGLLLARAPLVALSFAKSPRGVIAERLVRAAFAVEIALLYGVHQAPRLREQIDFFAKASRNVRDQHLVAGEHLRRLGARRVLVGDAGAIIYAADVAGLDLIGLGGYRDLPLARASVNGLGASLELIERIPARDRPDYLALYPSWWGDLPALFGRRVDAVRIDGNVICGDDEDVIYRADWSALDPSGAPRTLAPGERAIDELDTADLVSEREHDYVFPSPAMGLVTYRVLAEPKHVGESDDARHRDLFDAGRTIPEGQEVASTLRGPSGRGRLAIRTIAAHALTVLVRVEGREVGRLAIPRSSAWIEPSIDLPEGTPKRFRLTLEPVDGELFDAHLWVIERASGGAANEGPANALAPTTPDAAPPAK